MRMWPDASKDVLPPVIHLPIFLLLLLCGQPAIQPSICLSIHPSHPSSMDGIRGSDMGGKKKASNCKADQLTREFARGTLLHKSAGGGGVAIKAESGVQVGQSDGEDASVVSALGGTGQGPRHCWGSVG